MSIKGTHNGQKTKWNLFYYQIINILVILLALT